jgi:hypothetical protein
VSTPADPVTRPRVVVLSLSYKLRTRVRSYVQDLVDAGVDIDLLVAENSSTEEAALDPRVRVHRVFDAKAFGKARSLTVGRPALKKVDAGLALTRRAQSRVSKGIHKKMFWPTFKIMRPLILSRRGQQRLAELDLARADRIVAADQPAVPLAWRLSRRYPGVRTTTALDRKPYVGDK